jgi:hypothetical protein
MVAVAAGVHRHSAYGLTIRSDIALPELPAAGGSGGDIIIERGELDRPLPATATGTDFVFGPEIQRLDWLAVGKFEIRGTSHIVFEPAPGVSDEVVRLPLLGPVMALLLHLRGLLVLHASAIAVGAHSAVFLGDKRAGKSTTAAALVGAGHRLLTDDVLAFAFEGGVPHILPSFPQIKLTDESADAVRIAGAAVRPLAVPGFDKRQHHLTDRFSGEASPARRIYVLERGDNPGITALSPGDALAALIRFSYVTRFDRSAISPAAAGTHLRQCAMLAGRSIVRRLEVPNGLDRLGEAVAMIEDDLG